MGTSCAPSLPTALRSSYHSNPLCRTAPTVSPAPTPARRSARANWFTRAFSSPYERRAAPMISAGLSGNVRAWCSSPAVMLLSLPSSAPQPPRPLAPRYPSSLLLEGGAPSPPASGPGKATSGDRHQSISPIPGRPGADGAAPSTKTFAGVHGSHAVMRAWPSDGVTRVPFWIYTDPELYAREQERIFG